MSSYSKTNFLTSSSRSSTIQFFLHSPVTEIPRISHQTFLKLEGKISNSSKFTNFTDLLRLLYVNTFPDFSRGEFTRLNHIYNAAKLDNRGVKFEVLPDHFSLDIRFQNGCLTILGLMVDEKTEMRLRNIMALEQCHYPFNAHVCNYVIFLDNLIDTHKDVELLVEKGIINNWIGEDDYVAKMVNKLNIGIIDNAHLNYYSDIADEVNRYNDNPINKSHALLKRVYFGNLWTGTLTLAATFLLIMTFIQTVASIIQTIKK